MIISGVIIAVDPPDYTDPKWGNQYQNITVEGQNGLVSGRIGCKKPYTQQDIGAQGQWECEQSSNAQGAYNKLKKYYSPAPPQQAPQGGSRKPQQPNGNDMVRIRSMAVAYAKDLVCNGMNRSLLADMADEFTAYIMTGRWVSKSTAQGQSNPDYEENPSMPEDDIPF